MIRRPNELSPVILRELDPGPKPLFGLQEMAHAYQKPSLDCLTVSAAFAMPRSTAELNRLEIGAVNVEQRQRRVAIGTAGSVARMVPAHARADVVTEVSKVGLSCDERAQIVWVRDDRVAIGVPYSESLVE